MLTVQPHDAGVNVYWLYGATGAAHPLVCNACTSAGSSSNVTIATEAVSLAFAGTAAGSQAADGLNITAAEACSRLAADLPMLRKHRSRIMPSKPGISPVAVRIAVHHHACVASGLAVRLQVIAPVEVVLQDYYRQPVSTASGWLCEVAATGANISSLSGGTAVTDHGTAAFQDLVVTGATDCMLLRLVP